MPVNPYVEYYNANPWKTRHPNDCAIRAVAAAIRMKYDAVCEAFGRKSRPGYGLDGPRGIPLEAIKRRFDKFFDRVEDAEDAAFENRPEEFDDMDLDPAFDTRSDMGITLVEFCEMYDGQGRFMVSVVANPNAESAECRGFDVGHIVYANLKKPGDPRFYDTWDCGECIVRAFMRVRGILNKRDPRSVYFEKA